MSTTHQPKSHRLAAGYYEVETEIGTFTVELVENARVGNGYPPRAWHVTWPGERTPDATFDTKRECMGAIAYAVRQAVDC